MRRDETPFQFHDTSARAPFARYREVVNRWLSEVPEEHRSDLLGRLRNGSSAQYHAALTELTVHAALVRLGWSVEIHPTCPHPARRPDFLVRDRSGETLGFVEVTTFGPEPSTTASGNREAAFFHALDEAVLPPGRLLRYSVLKRGTSTASATRLRRDVERWASEAAAGEAEGAPHRVFEAGDWRFDIHLDLWPRASGTRSIGADVRGLRTTDPAGDLRAALDLKADRYRIEGVPYLIVVADCKDAILMPRFVHDALIDALFGTRSWRVTFDAARQVASEEPDRADDGFWGRDGEPRHRNVSGVLLIPDPGLLKLRENGWQPLLATNPFAGAPMDRRILPVPGYGPVDVEEGYGFVDGTWLADVLGLPGDWPGDE